MRRTIAFAACVVLMGVGCTEDDPAPEPRTRATSSPRPEPEPTEMSLVTELPEVCDGLGAPNATGQISFVTNDRLYLATPDGDIRCAGILDNAERMEWNGTGHRLLVTDSNGVDLVSRNLERAHVSDPVALAHLSRPTGTSVLTISEDHETFTKTALSRLADVQHFSFPTYADAVAYHPSGTLIATAGLDVGGARGPFSGTYGIYLSDNLGNDPRRVAHVESLRGPYDPAAPPIAALAWNRNGDTLYFTASHGKRHHLHRVVFGADEGRFVGTASGAVTAGPEPITALQVSQFDGRRRVAFARGTCESGHTTSVAIRNRDVHPLREVPGSVTPVGWLPDGQLVVAAREEACDGPSDLYLWSEEGAELLVTDVDLAAIRAALPEPPDPPAPVGDQVVA